MLVWIESQAQVMRQRVITWCDINSYTFNLEGIAMVGEAVSHVLKSLGAKIEWIDLPPAESIDSRGKVEQRKLGCAMRATKRADSKKKVFLGIHLDTVYPPEQGFLRVEKLNENVLRGPGVIDAKGGLVVMLTALEALERSSIASEIGWEVILNPDEEIGSPGSAHLFVEAARRNDVGLVFEPAIGEGNLVDERKGTGNFTVIVHGRAAHAGRDFAAGRNAIATLAEMVVKLHALNGTMPGVIVNVGKIEGGGALNVVPDLAIARMNVRTTVPEDETHVREAIESVVAQFADRDGIRIELHGSITSPPKILDVKTKQLLDSILACARELGLNVTSQPSGGASDGNKLAASGLPVIDSMGPRGGKLHSPEEFLYLDSLVERAKLTAMVLAEIAFGKL